MKYFSLKYWIEMIWHFAEIFISIFIRIKLSSNRPIVCENQQWFIKWKWAGNQSNAFEMKHIYYIEILKFKKIIWFQEIQDLRWRRKVKKDKNFLELLQQYNAVSDLMCPVSFLLSCIKVSKVSNPTMQRIFICRYENLFQSCYSRLLRPSRSSKQISSSQ